MCQWRASKKTALIRDILAAAIDKPADSRGCLLVKTMIKRKAINGSKVAGIAAVNDGSCSQSLIIGMLVVFMGSKVQRSPFKVARLRSPVLAVFQVRGFAPIGMLQ
jgi:hypothetical protein